jgi:hypothetical protein
MGISINIAGKGGEGEEVLPINVNRGVCGDDKYS